MKEDLLMENNNKNNLKKPLIYGAAAFLVFIIAVIGFAIFQNTKNENNQIVPAENKPQEVKPQPQQNNTNFQPLQIEEETPKIDKQALVEEKPQQKPKTEEPKTEENIENINKNANEVEIKQPQEEKIVETVKKPAVKNTKPALLGKYYIQVAALLKHATPNKKFLQLIKKSGFNYKFYTTYIVRNGEKIKVTKVLVGPFKTRSEAKKALLKVKQKITQNAFIFKVK